MGRLVHVCDLCMFVVGLGLKLKFSKQQLFNDRTCIKKPFSVQLLVIIENKVWADVTEEPKPGLHWTRWMDSEGLSITGIHVFEIAPPLHQQEAPTVQIHFFFASLSVVSRLMTSFWCVWKRKQHFLFQTLFSSQTAVLPKSFSSVFNVFIKDVFVNLWSGLVFSSLFFGTDWSQKRRQAENPNYISTAPLSL